jgi:hypothetical protein
MYGELKGVCFVRGLFNAAVSAEVIDFRWDAYSTAGNLF